MQSPLFITDALCIPGSELDCESVRSSGPGGQNVNKVASKVELRFDLPITCALDAATIARLRILAKNRLDAQGRVLVSSQLTRDRSRNLEDARQKLRDLILRALKPPTPRRPTCPTRAAQKRRVQDKRQHSARKQQRRQQLDD